MPNVTFVQPDGVERDIDVPLGWSLMEAARRDDVAGIVAECGGGAICGTCHVHVQADRYDELPPAEITESALLDIVPQSCPSSRLACQVIMTDALAGLRVEIPNEQLNM